MQSRLCLLLATVVCVALARSPVKSFTQGERKALPPQWATHYTVEGLIQLPYAEISEPFKAYYNAESKKSRIDYYGDAVQTFQRADLNPPQSFKVIYYSMDTKGILNGRTCFQAGLGDSDPQASLPDLTNFSMVGQEKLGNMTLIKWQFTEQNGQKANTYTMWVRANDNSPFKYEMMGFDSLFGSHYDKYYIDYLHYDTSAPDDSIFNVSSEYKCQGFPGPGKSNATMVSQNPMREFLGRRGHPSGHSAHVDEGFSDFKRTHNKNYKDDREHFRRREIYRQNLRFVHSTNRRRDITYRVAINHLADWDRDERKALRGHRPSKRGSFPGLNAFDKSKYPRDTIPDSLDWRIFGAVTPVKDQAICGSCWSFGTTGTIEGALFVKTGHLVRLSQQELIDCSWGEANNGCDGGEDFRAYQWIMNNGGLSSSDSYGPYLAQDMKCRASSSDKVARISGYVNVTVNDEEALKAAIAMFGPVSVAIDASQPSFSFYSHGIYYDSKCKNDPDGLDHAVLAVGYGIIGSDRYWLVKNSWSTYWGNDGYILMSPINNNCGVMTSPTYVEIAN